MVPPLFPSSATIAPSSVSAASPVALALVLLLPSAPLCVCLALFPVADPDVSLATLFLLFLSMFPALSPSHPPVIDAVVVVWKPLSPVADLHH